jgi:glutamate dehydrogenase/leucine dehydrogenase
MKNGHAEKHRVAVIGSGNWGSVASRLIASNTAKLPAFHGKQGFLHSLPGSEMEHAPPCMFFNSTA